MISKAQSIWADAKVNNDYNKFAPTLDEIIKFNKRYVKYLETDNLKGYNVLLDMYEEGMTKEKYDKFFTLKRYSCIMILVKYSVRKEVKYEENYFPVTCIHDACVNDRPCFSSLGFQSPSEIFKRRYLRSR